jgi:hypothetical protein
VTAAVAHSAAAAREHQRLLRELYSASPDEMLNDLQQAIGAAHLRVDNIVPGATGSAATLDRLAEHLDGCRRQALKLAQRIRAWQA